MNEPELGQGRLPTNIYKKIPKNFKKMNCSECGREYLIKWGEGRKIFKTCNSTCSQKRMTRKRAVLAAKNRSSKKVITIYLDFDVFKKLNARADKLGMPVSRHAKEILLESLKK
jgi:hypothetical protein